MRKTISRMRNFKVGQPRRESRKREERKDIATIFGNVLFEDILVREGDHVRSIAKIEAAIRAILENAVHGDHRAFEKIISLGEKLGVLTPSQQKYSEDDLAAEAKLFDEE